MIFCISRRMRSWAPWVSPNSSYAAEILMQYLRKAFDSGQESCYRFPVFDIWVHYRLPVALVWYILHGQISSSYDPGEAVAVQTLPCLYCSGFFVETPDPKLSAQGVLPTPPRPALILELRGRSPIDGWHFCVSIALSCHALGWLRLVRCLRRRSHWRLPGANCRCAGWQVLRGYR